MARVGAMHMTRTSMGDGRLFGNHGQLVQDSTVLGLLGAKAGFTQAFKLLFKLPQFPHAGGNVADVLVQQLIDDAAVLGRSVLETKQHPYFIKCHVQATAMPNEQQPLAMFLAVDAVVAAAAPRLRQQALALVKTDGFNLGIGLVRQFSDFHRCLQNAAQPAPDYA